MMIEKKNVYDGVKYTFKFSNGYGASVVRYNFSYGHEKGLWEVVVLKRNNQGELGLCYDSPITDDVLGNLTEEEVFETLHKIHLVS